jgi:DNA-binding transcriptional LysR family regulator
MSTIDLFDDLPAFVAVVEAGSFAAAARRLNLSRSAVSKAIVRLEQRLAVRLFHRTTRSQNLTDDGQAFYEHCAMAVSALQAGKSMLESGRNVISGTLRVTMPVLFGRLRVAPILTRLADEHPDLSLELDFRDQHLDLVDAGMDLAIRLGPVGVGTGLMARRIVRRRMLVCAAPSYIERRGVPNGPDDLRRHEAVVYSRDGRVQGWKFLQSDGSISEVTLAARLRINDLGAILDTVLAGQGVAWLPEWLVSGHVAPGDLVELLPNCVSRSDDIHAVWPEAPYLPTRVRIAIDRLAGGLAQAQT